MPTTLPAVLWFALSIAAATGAAAQAPSTSPLAVRLGPADAPAQLTIFCDIEAEACERLMVLLQRAIDEHPGKVEVTFRHLAADGHKPSALAYRSALAAARQGKGWQFLDMACANRDRLTDAGLQSMATQLQLDVPRFESDAAASDLAQVLEDDAAAAKAMSVEAVPAVFLNGARVADVSTFDALEAAIKEAIR